MSAYTVVRCAFQDRAALVAALEEVFGEGAVEAARGPRENSLRLYGYHGDMREAKWASAVVVRRRHVGPAANDLGFRWNGREYEAIVSRYDRGQGLGPGGARMSKVMAVYSAVAVRNVLRRKATWRESLKKDGSLVFEARFGAGAHRDVRITVDGKSGEVEVDVVGGRGPGCMARLREISAGLGGAQVRGGRKPEYTMVGNLIQQSVNFGGPLCG